MNSKKVMGLSLATTAAVLFATLPVPVAFADTTPIACYGANACKGQSDCKSIKNACSGENACKGQGLAYLPPEDCATEGGDENPPSAGGALSTS